MAVADLIVFMTERLTAGGCFVAAVPPLETAVVFLTTVPVLASLDSLDWLIFLLPRVDPVAGAVFLDLEAVPVVLELVVAFWVPAAAPRVDLAFWTILDIKLEEDFVLRALDGEAGRAIMDLAGEEEEYIWLLAGEVGLSAALGRTRALVDAGERICPVKLRDASAAAAAAGAPRPFFLGTTVGSTEFSLSSALEMVSLRYS